MKNDFDYGVIKIGHRLNINKAINHEEIILNKVICVGMVNKCMMFQPDICWWEFQILYRDENNECQCGIYKVDDYTLDILHKGNMQFSI